MYFAPGEEEEEEEVPSDDSDGPRPALPVTEEGSESGDEDEEAGGGAAAAPPATAEEYLRRVRCGSLGAAWAQRGSIGADHPHTRWNGAAQTRGQGHPRRSRLGRGCARFRPPSGRTQCSLRVRGAALPWTGQGVASARASCVTAAAPRRRPSRAQIYPRARFRPAYGPDARGGGVYSSSLPLFARYGRACAGVASRRRPCLQLTAPTGPGRGALHGGGPRAARPATPRESGRGVAGLPVRRRGHSADDVAGSGARPGPRATTPGAPCAVAGGGLHRGRRRWRRWIPVSGAGCVGVCAAGATAAPSPAGCATRDPRQRGRRRRSARLHGSGRAAAVPSTLPPRRDGGGPLKPGLKSAGPAGGVGRGGDRGGDRRGGVAGGGTLAARGAGKRVCGAADSRKKRVGLAMGP